MCVLSDIKTEYRIMKSYTDCGDVEYSIQETYLDEDGCVCGHTIDLDVRGQSISDIKEIMTEMMECFDKQVFMELKSSIKE